MKVKLFLSFFLMLKIGLGQIIINEVLYDPTGVDTGLEWIELYNPGGSALIMTGYCLYASGEHYIFPTFTLNSGAYLLIHWNLDGTDSASNLYTGTTSWSNMGNTAEAVALWNTHSSHTSSTILDYVEYGDSNNPYDGTAESASVWTAGDFALDVTEGHSLEYDGSGDMGSDWFDQTIPTPGTDNALPVELSYFTANESFEGVLLEWRTESEFENIGFFIERKTEDTAWSELVSYKDDDTLLGQGTVSYHWDYEYTDRFVKKGKKYYYRLADVDQNGVITYHQSASILVDSNPLSAVPDRLSIRTYPNPFNPTVNILYSVAINDNIQLTPVSINIYNIKGEFVKSLLDSELPHGWHSIQWDGLDSKGYTVPGGTYFCQIIAGNEVRNNKIVYLK